MAITAAQRTTAVTNLLNVYNNPQQLAQLIPGLTPAGLVNAIVGAIGTNFDAQLTTAMNNLVANLNTQLAGAQGSVTAIQAQITTDTVV